ncbi:hypothetical protein ABIE26_002988 [Pedobacter africanus]|uniref:terpene synthase family protein n=1 Tax=Pedobacter africanus TaxID=151894 RepID=UPI0033925D10
MNPIRIPELYCPANTAISPFVDEAILQVREWIIRFKLIPHYLLAKYESQRFVHMTARFYPKITLTRLVLLSKFFTLLFLSDDELDHESNRKSQSFWREFAQQFMGVISGDLYFPPGSGNPAFEALTDCWSDMRRLSSLAWQRKFAESLKQMYRAAFWENANLVEGKRITIAEYIQLRQYLGAANIATDAIEFAYPDLHLPGEIMELPQIYTMVEKCRDTICWANDLFSLAKELEHGGVHNLVMLIQAEQGLSLRRAIAETVRKHNNDVLEFLSSWKSIAGEGVHRSIVNEMALRLLNLMRGNIDWSVMDTSRYYGFSFADVPLSPKIHIID